MSAEVKTSALIVIRKVVNGQTLFTYFSIITFLVTFPFLM